MILATAGVEGQNERGRRMSSTEKLVDKMRRSPSGIRFGEVETLLRRSGFVLFNSRGSHRTITTPTAGS